VTEEVPSVIYGITAGRPLRLKNSLGEFRFHHLPGPLFWGYAPAGAYRNYALAEPEKAFLDLVYLGLHPRSPLGLPFSRHGRWPLDMQKLHRYAQKFRSRKLNGYIRSL
jgi:hypothetical protein